MSVSVFDVIYEGFYTARLLAGIGIFGLFFLTPRFKRRYVMIVLFAALTLLGASFSFFNGAGDYLPESIRNNIKWINVLWYSCMLLAIFFVLILMFKGRIGGYFYVYALSAFAECFIFGFNRIFYDMGVTELRVNTPLSIAIEFFTSAAVYAGLYLYGKKSLKKLFDDEYVNKSSIIIYFVATITFNMFLRFKLQSVYELVKDEEFAWVINVILFLVPLFFFVIDIGIERLLVMKNEQKILSTLMNERERQYAYSKENIDAINRKCHDIRRQIRALNFMDGEQRQASIKEVADSVRFYDSEAHTSNEVLNALLSEKGIYCASHGIRLGNIADGEAVAFMSAVDIYTMFGNMIDNAIEAVEKLPDGEKRVIGFSVQVKKGVMCAETNNYFDGKIKIVDGLPETTKDDKIYHGYGVRSIKHIAEKYGGTMSVCTDGDIFYADVNIPFKQ